MTIMTLYLKYKEEWAQAGMQEPKKTYSPEFLDNTPEKGFSHLKSAAGEPASKPASEPAEK